MAAIAFLLGAGLIIMIVNRILLVRELRRMACTMEELRRSNSSRRLTVGTQNKDIAALAASINTLYQENQEIKAEYIRQNSALRQSMADISHDLRTPLTALLGYLKLLYPTGDRLDKQQQYQDDQYRDITYLDIAYDKANTLHKLVSSLFDLAKLESGAFQFVWETIDIKALLEQELASSYAWFSESGREPVIDISSGRMHVHADRAAMQRILGNLIQNALQHSSGSVAVKAYCKKNTIFIQFSNYAPHLTQEDIPHLFERTFMADKMRTSSGSGLGLAIVKEFTIQMGGQANAVLNEGTLYIMLNFPMSQ